MKNIIHYFLLRINYIGTINAEFLSYLAISFLEINGGGPSSSESLFIIYKRMSFFFSAYIYVFYFSTIFNVALESYCAIIYAFNFSITRLSISNYYLYSFTFAFAYYFSSIKLYIYLFIDSFMLISSLML